MGNLKEVTLAEVQKHSSEGDCWVVVKGVVYDVSDFAEVHPGGVQILLNEGGKDATEQFQLFHTPDVLEKYGPRLRVGKLKGYREPSRFIPPNTFGDLIPYGDPAWYQRFNSPYFTRSHEQWRTKVREFVEKEVVPNISKWDRLDELPKDFLVKAGKAGMIAGWAGPPWPSLYTEGVEGPEDYDYFHELILIDEFARCGSAAFIAAMASHVAIAIPVLLHFASDALKRKVVSDVLMGRKVSALAISEPHGGSDVAGLKTTARREGDYYIVNGNKKYITNGTYADYFMVAVRTGPPDSRQKGISYLLMERDMPGFSIRKVEVRGAQLSGTSYLDFNNVKVPVEYLIGKENEGFKLIMYNFNHERLYLIIQCNRYSRMCLEESIRYAMRRETFGKKLHEHQAIRMKIADMAREVEAMQAWIELVTYQMCTMRREDAMVKLGDVLSMMKAHASKIYSRVSREAVLIYGGSGMLSSGVGAKVERLALQALSMSIPGGTEEILLDFAARSAFKMAKIVSKL